MESSRLNDPSFSINKQIKNPKEKAYHQIHQHHHQHHQYLAARLSNIWRQSSCGSNIIPHQQFAPPPPPPHVKLEMVHASTGSVFLNHFLNNNQISLNSSLPSILPSHHPHHHHHRHQPPPLLPLPVVSKPSFHSLPPLTRRTSLSTPLPRKHTTQKNLKASSSATQTNKKKSTNHQKIMNKKQNPSNEAVGSTKGVGPKEETRVQKKEGGDNDDIGKFIGASSVICVSPPPSSLPLPRFSLKAITPK